MKRHAYAGVMSLALALMSPAGSTADSASTPDCGKKIFKGAGTAWRCTFVDHFDGTDLDQTRWSALTTKRTNLGVPHCFVDSPNNISVHDGSLHLTIRKEPTPFYCEAIVGGYPTQYTAGGVFSRNKFSQTYGRFETRAAFQETREPGLHAAIWMWPQGGKAKYGDNNGEIDTAEFWTARPDVVKPYVHYDNEDNDPHVTADCEVDDHAEFHTYAVEWTPQTLTFIYDGEVCLVNDWDPKNVEKPAPFDEPFFMTMNVSFGGYLPHYVDAPLPQTMKVDYVKAWS